MEDAPDMISAGGIPKYSLPTYGWPTYGIPGSYGAGGGGGALPQHTFPVTPSAIPKVPGSWYYLYINTKGQFAVSPLEPTYNTTYYEYYHPTMSDNRAIGKFYVGADGDILYVQ